MKLAWLTDIHLSHASQQSYDALTKSLSNSTADAFIITGDIGEGLTHQSHLSRLEQIARRKIYVVLGNHDFYGSSIKEVRDGMRKFQNYSSYIRYLSSITYEKLSQTTALVGHDCWYDAINGDFANTKMLLNDFKFIKEYYDITQGDIVNNFERHRTKVIELSRALSRESVEHVQKGIKEALRFAKTIVVASHPTPFVESHIFEGQTGSPSSQPWFTSKLLGDLLISAAKSYPNVKFISLSGHTHGEFHGNLMSNLEVHVGGADYGNPIVQKTSFEL